MFEVRRTGLILGIIVAALVLLLPVDNLIRFSLSIFSLCIIWWLTEAIPIGVTGLIPLALAPLFGILRFDEIILNYFSGVVFLLLAGFILASAVSRWNIDKKIAYSLVSLARSDSHFLLLAIIASAAILSLIMPNTAAAALMVPVGLGIINSIRKMENGYKTVLLLIIAYSASIGGTALLIGTPPNLIAADYLRSEGFFIDFLTWSKMVLPFSIIFLLGLWVYSLLTSRAPRKVKVDLRKIKLTDEAWLTIFVILTVVFLWFTKQHISSFLGFRIEDAVIGLFGSFLLLFLPIHGRRLLHFDEVKIPWGILLMFGGGLALGNLLLASGTAEYLIQFLDFIPQNLPLLILITAIITTFTTEFISNTALAAALIPIVIPLYKSFGFDPFLGILTVAVCSSTAFMFPIATPPNAMVYKTHKITFSTMARYGFILNILAVLLWTAYVNLVLL